MLRVDRFGFSANNVAYATLGEAMRYWELFPAPDGWGRIPVWGYGDVARSAHDEIREGERVFGYLPMSTHVVVQPEQVSDRGFADGVPHRAELPAVYQRYSRVAGDPHYDPEHEDQQALSRPLFMTSFGAADYLTENDLFGARAAVLSSASSAQCRLPALPRAAVGMRGDRADVAGERRVLRPRRLLRPRSGLRRAAGTLARDAHGGRRLRRRRGAAPRTAGAPGRRPPGRLHRRRDALGGA